MSDNDTLPKYKPKKYHKRSTWACDECKLRKKKCDGLQPCAKCTLYEKECTYESRTRPSQPPTQRIRDLEENLRSIRELLVRIKPELSESSSADVDQMLATLKPAATDAPSDPSPLLESPKTPFAVDGVPLRSMLLGRGRLLRSGSRTLFHGPYSGASFLCAVLEFFDGTNTELLHPQIIRLFDEVDSVLDPGLVCVYENAYLPERASAHGLFNVMTRLTHPHLQFLDRPALWHLFNMVYDNGARSVSPGALTLFYNVLALGCLMDTQYHRQEGCEMAIADAKKYYSVSQEIHQNLGVDDLTSLQALLCSIAYLISTSQLSAAYTFVSVATVSTVKQGLHMTAEVKNGSTKSVMSTQKQTLTCLVTMDLFVSTLLGLPPVMNIDTAGTTMGSGEELSRASHSFFGQHAGRPDMKDTLLDLSSKHCQIASLIASVIRELGSSSAKQEGEFDATTVVDSSIMKQASIDLASWCSSVGLSPSLSLHISEDNTGRRRTGFELSTWWAQLTLNTPFLHHLKSLSQDQLLPDVVSRPALTCVKVANQAISRSESILEEGLAPNALPTIVHPSNWAIIYTIFLAVTTLIFLISLHQGTDESSEVWRKATAGIKILAALRCREGGATKCLAVIKELSRQLNLKFDFQQIENSTRRLCEKQHHGSSAKHPPTQSHTTSRPPSSSTSSDPQPGSRRSISRTTADDILARAQSLLPEEYLSALDEE